MQISWSPDSLQGTFKCLLEFYWSFGSGPKEEDSLSHCIFMDIPYRVSCDLSRICRQLGKALLLKEAAFGYPQH